MESSIHAAAPATAELSSAKEEGPSHRGHIAASESPPQSDLGQHDGREEVRAPPGDDQPHWDGLSPALDNAPQTQDVAAAVSGDVISGASHQSRSDAEISDATGQQVSTQTTLSDGQSAAAEEVQTVPAPLLNVEAESIEEAQSATSAEPLGVPFAAPAGNMYANQGAQNVSGETWQAVPTQEAYSYSTAPPHASLPDFAEQSEAALAAPRQDAYSVERPGQEAQMNESYSAGYTSSLPEAAESRSGDADHSMTASYPEDDAIMLAGVSTPMQPELLAHTSNHAKRKRVRIDTYGEQTVYRQEKIAAAAAGAGAGAGAGVAVTNHPVVSHIYQTLVNTLLVRARKIHGFLKQNEKDLGPPSGGSQATWRELDTVVSQHAVANKEEESEVSFVPMEVAIEKLVLTSEQFGESNAETVDDMLHLAESSFRDFGKSLESQVRRLADQLIESRTFVEQLERLLCEELRKNSENEHREQYHESKYKAAIEAQEKSAEVERVLRFELSTLRKQMRGQLHQVNLLLGSRKVLFQGQKQ